MVAISIILVEGKMSQLPCEGSIKSQTGLKNNVNNLVQKKEKPCVSTFYPVWAMQFLSRKLAKECCWAGHAATIVQTGTADRPDILISNT